MAKLKLPFTYHNVEVVRVVDGDTVRLRIDVGFRMVFEDNFRLADINSPERHQEGGPAATSHMEMLIREAYDIHDGLIVDVTKRDKYGRYLAVLWVGGKPEALSLNEQMIQDGHAVLYD